MSYGPGDPYGHRRLRTVSVLRVGDFLYSSPGTDGLHATRETYHLRYDTAIPPRNNSGRNKVVT